MTMINPEKSKLAITHRIYSVNKSINLSLLLLSLPTLAPFNCWINDGIYENIIASNGNNANPFHSDEAMKE